MWHNAVVDENFHRICIGFTVMWSRKTKFLLHQWIYLFAFVIVSYLLLHKALYNMVHSSNPTPIPTYYAPNDTIIESFLSKISPVNPIVVDPNVVKCLLNRNVRCTNLPESRVLRFALLPEQWKEIDLLKNFSTIIAKKSSVTMQIGAAKFVLSKMERKQNYWIIPETRTLNLKQLRLPVTRDLSDCVFGSQRALVMPNLKILLNFLQGQFIECRHDLAEQLRRENAYMYYWWRVVIKDSFVKMLAAVVDFSYTLGMRPILFGGTLLGWYRECGFIPHTSDSDFGVFASEIGMRKRDGFRLISHYVPECIWNTQFGWINQTNHQLYEFSIYCNKVKVDFFALYDDGNVTWAGGADFKNKLRWTYPLISEHDTCFGDLLGYLFFVPCKVEEVLRANYGPRWYKVHHTDDFDWRNSPKNVQIVGTVENRTSNKID